MLIVWEVVMFAQDSELLPWKDLPVRGELALAAWEEVLTVWVVVLPALD